jgi:hypothetical protein
LRAYGSQNLKWAILVGQLENAATFFEEKRVPRPVTGLGAFCYSLKIKM